MTDDELSVKYWKGRADEAKAALDEALGIIQDLLGLELGSADRAIEFLYKHSPTIEEARGIRSQSPQESSGLAALPPAQPHASEKTGDGQS